MSTISLYTFCLLISFLTCHQLYKKCNYEICLWHWQWPLVHFYRWVFSFLYAYAFELICILHQEACRLQVIQILQTHLMMWATGPPMMNTNLHMFARSHFHFEEVNFLYEHFLKCYSKHSAWPQIPVLTSCFQYSLPPF